MIGADKMLRELGVIDVGADDVARILATEETHFVDVKAQELTPAKLCDHASAFANTAGGEIFVGIDDEEPRKWRGFPTVEAANGHVQALDKIFQGNDVVSVQFIRGAGVSGFVLRLLIEKSREIIKSTDGTIYKRVSAQRLPVALTSHEELQRLALDKGIATFEDMPLRDAPDEAITDSYVVTEFMIEAVPVTEARPWLESQRLLVDGSPTVAGVLLFADEPQVYLPKRSAIKLLRYKSSDVEGHRDQLEADPQTFEGCLTQQIEAAVDAIVSMVQSTPVQTGKGLEAVTYPRETLHEIVTNAVLHRDYSIQTDVQVRVFDNRIEVESPGKLPGHITEENIFDEQFARNGKIVRLINKFPNPPNKDVGEGLNTAAQKMRDIGLKPPSVREQGESVVVYIRHERLASYEDQIIDYLIANKEINNSKARAITGEGSENKMKRVFEGMMTAKQIIRDPNRRGNQTTYFLHPEFAKQAMTTSGGGG